MKADKQGIPAENKKKFVSNLKKAGERMVREKPALSNDKIAGALRSHVVKVAEDHAKNMKAKAEAEDDDDCKGMEPATKVTKKGGKTSGNPYEVVQKGGGVVVRNKETGDVRGRSHPGERP